MSAVFAETISRAGSSASEVLGPMTGRRYIDSLKDGREVWIDGARVEDVTQPIRPSHRPLGVKLAFIFIG